MTELAGTVAGPPDTPYSGGKYKLEIKIPDTYPFNPPKVGMFVIMNLYKIIIFLGEIYYKNLASQRVKCNWGYMPGHSKGPVGRCHDSQVFDQTLSYFNSLKHKSVR